MRLRWREKPPSRERHGRTYGSDFSRCHVPRFNVSHRFFLRYLHNLQNRFELWPSIITPQSMHGRINPPLRMIDVISPFKKTIWIGSFSMTWVDAFDESLNVIRSKRAAASVALVFSTRQENNFNRFWSFPFHVFLVFVDHVFDLLRYLFIHTHTTTAK